MKILYGLRKNTKTLSAETDITYLIEAILTQSLYLNLDAFYFIHPSHLTTDAVFYVMKYYCENEYIIAKEEKDVSWRNYLAYIIKYMSHSV